MLKWSSREAGFRSTLTIKRALYGPQTINQTETKMNARMEYMKHRNTCSVLAEGGVVLSYGQFYGPGTYNEQLTPAEPRDHIDRAAERTVEALGEPTGVVVIVD